MGTQTASLNKKKLGASLGYRTPGFFRGSKFGSDKAMYGKFNTSSFRIQHKGGA